jgi:aryl-phospho-beta-D-glucosidase BglC (GH1 family)
MGMGWNLGNTFDSYDTSIRNNPSVAPGRHIGNDLMQIETLWLGNNHARATTQTLIQQIKDLGFTSIRIPITWNNVIDREKNWEIWTPYMDRIQEVVDWAYNAGLYVIINVHHDEHIIAFSSGEPRQVTNDSGAITPEDRLVSETVLRRIWEQIGERFNNGYSSRLVFEGLNEPRTFGSPNQWVGGTPHERAFLNDLNQLFVDTVRAQGGNNAWRTLMVPTYAANGRDNRVLREFQVPEDVVPNRIALSLHDYAPFDWAHNGEGEYTGAASIIAQLDSVQAFSNARFGGIPIVLGEWGSVRNATNDLTASRTTPEIRARHAEDFVYEALIRGMAPLWWDNGNGNDAARGHGFGLVARAYPHAPYHQVIIDGMIAGRTRALAELAN